MSKNSVSTRYLPEMCVHFEAKGERRKAKNEAYFLPWWAKVGFFFLIFLHIYIFFCTFARYFAYLAAEHLKQKF